MRHDREVAGFIAAFAAASDAPAIHTAEELITYGELDRRIGLRMTELGTERRLILIQTANEVEPLITYLAALRACHPVMLVASDKPADDVIAAYRPDLVFSQRSDGWALDEHRAVTEHDLHPDLALLLSTSGSTGTSKFVRLSRENLEANARSIAAYLGIRPSDRAATSLPLHYCYGLSIVHSHLLMGASVILTDHSVIDDEFWQLFATKGGTTFPAVPFTFDLLDRVGFEAMDLSNLRYITQAGGRLAPEQVRRYAEMGVRRGFDLFVMYGATEATARMAYLPPDMAAANPSAIGRAIPGGSFELAADGELIYSGPNVMLGYAEGAQDLGRGRDIERLHTGDLARRLDNGLFEIVGRKSRFLKIFGLRIALDAVEAHARAIGVPAHATGTDDHLVLATDAIDRASELHAAAADRFGLPLSAITVQTYDEVPRLSSGKVDYPAIRRDADLATSADNGNKASRAGAASTDGATTVRTLFAASLGLDNVTNDDTFVSLGGDSLSYIETSLALEDHLGRVPDDWHLTTVGELDRLHRSTSVLRQVETNVVLRAVAIVLILGDHFELFDLQGGAHVLLAVAGYNFSRFLANRIVDVDSIAPIVPTLARILIPTVAWQTLTFALKGSFDARVFFLVSSYWTDPDGGYWFIEVLVQILLLATLSLALPVLRQLYRSSPYQFAVGMLAIALAARYGIDSFWDTSDIGYKVPHMTLWLFTMGWVADRSTERWQKLALSAAVVATVPGYFDATSRTTVIMVGLLALVWLTRISLPKPANRVVATLGTASLYLYLVHFQVNTVLSVDRPLFKFFVAVAFGLVAWWVGERTLRYGEARLRSHRRSGADTPDHTLV